MMQLTAGSSWTGTRTPPPAGSSSRRHTSCSRRSSSRGMTSEHDTREVSFATSSTCHNRLADVRHAAGVTTSLLDLAAIIIDCADPRPVAEFYVAAADGEVVRDDPDGVWIRFGGNNVIFRR